MSSRYRDQTPFVFSAVLLFFSELVSRWCYCFCYSPMWLPSALTHEHGFGCVSFSIGFTRVHATSISFEIVILNVDVGASGLTETK